ncbi:hypothetical protein RPPS3_36550 [Rhodopseudomonas palustris]|nr:hypothetical protein RPPS3_36550 [Rhodopseudomonas palustris]
MRHRACTTLTFRTRVERSRPESLRISSRSGALPRSRRRRDDGAQHLHARVHATALIAAKIVNTRPSSARRTSLAGVAEIVTECVRASSPALSPDATLAVLDLKLWNAGGTKHRRISANHMLARGRHQISPSAIADARNICAAVFSREIIRSSTSLTSKHKPDAPTHAGARKRTSGRHCCKVMRKVPAARGAPAGNAKLSCAGGYTARPGRGP